MRYPLKLTQANHYCVNPDTASPGTWYPTMISNIQELKEDYGRVVKLV